MHQLSLIPPLSCKSIWGYKPLFNKYLGQGDKVIFPKPTEDSKKALALLTHLIVYFTPRIKTPLSNALSNQLHQENKQLSPLQSHLVHPLSTSTLKCTSRDSLGPGTAKIHRHTGHIVITHGLFLNVLCKKASQPAQALV